MVKLLDLCICWGTDLCSPLGQIPTDEDVARLAKAGETILAIRMCRQIHNLDLAEAKAVVEKMAEPGVRR